MIPGGFLSGVASSRRRAGGGGGGGDFSGQEVVYLLMGQSNMVGRAGPIDGTLDATDANVLMYDATGDALVTAANPLDHFDETADTIGLGLSFGKELKSLSGAAKVILVGLAEGGTGFLAGDWNPLNGGTYNAALARWTAAWATIQAAYPSAVIGGILWIQGEDEIFDFPGSFGNGYAYLSMPLSMMDTARREFPGLTEATPAVFGSVPSGSSLTSKEPAYTQIQAALATVASRFNKTAYVDGRDLATFDNLHYSTTSLRTLGDRFAAAALTAKDSAFALPAPVTFVPDPANVETDISIDATGLPDYSAIQLNAGDNYVRENKRVYIQSGAMQFDGDAELRFGTASRGRRMLLGSRDFLFKTRFRSTNLTGNKGIWSLYDVVSTDRSYLLRTSTSTLQFYGSSDGATPILMFSKTIASNTWYDLEIKRVGTAMTFKVNGVTDGTYTLPGGFTFNVPPTAGNKSLIGDYANGNNFIGQIARFSLEFLS